MILHDKITQKFYLPNDFVIFLISFSLRFGLAWSGLKHIKVFHDAWQIEFFFGLRINPPRPHPTPIFISSYELETNYMLSSYHGYNLR